MGILLRIMLILLLILSIAALIIGLDLFQQREIIKGRLQLVETTLSDVARNIEAEDADDLAERDLPRIRLDRDQLRTFYRLDNQGKPLRDAEGHRVTTGPGTMDELLSNLRGRAAVQYTRLNDTRETLSQTLTQLADTLRELADTQTKLAHTESDLTQTRTELASARDTTSRQQAQITSLNSDKERMQGELDDQQEQIVRLRDEVATLRMEKEQDQRRIAELQARIDAIIQREPGEDLMVDGQRDVRAGQKGLVLMVNHDWNFVILDLTEEDRTIRPMLVLFVQREDQLVGKVRISEIKGEDRRLAIADIMGDWLQMPIREGDRVFF